MRTATRMILLAIVAVVVLWGVPALAFHDEGVAHCNGCHTMHNSYEGQLVDPDSPNGNDWLLIDATPSDTCLECHSTGTTRGVFNGDCATGASRENGAGNYIFLTCPDLRESTRGAIIPGERAGHNLNAPGHMLATDTTITMAPGGTFPSSLMGCTSCHDPHGTNSYRLLYGARLVQGTFPFTNPPPVAEKLASTGGETPSNHAAYQSGMSQWCGNCHTNFANIGTTHKHVVGVAMGATIATAYNLYAGSDNLFGGTQPTAYWPEVPFEDPAMTITSTQGPSGSSVVMCLTCHRAHATSAASAGRWDFNVTFNEEDGDTWGTYEMAQRISALSTNANRPLCNKCHVKDIDDAIFTDAEVSP